MVKPRNLNLAVLRNDPNEIYEGTCLSTDTKPTNWPDNSILFELDTGTRYYSNSGTWYPVGGGGDGGSSGGVNVVNLDDIPPYVLPDGDYSSSTALNVYINGDWTRIIAGLWFVGADVVLPAILYVSDYQSASLSYDRVNDYEASAGSTPGLYLTEADTVTIVADNFDNEYVFITNPTFERVEPT